MTRFPNFLDLTQSDPSQADVLLMPLPYEGTVSYGHGTARGPQAIWDASLHVEHWDEELNWELDSLAYFSAAALVPDASMRPKEYERRVYLEARQLHAFGGLVVGVGGEHSITPPLVSAACTESEDLSHVTVIQIDAHADLRDTYHGTSCSHACAMRRVLDKGANILAIGIRSADRDEFEYGRASGRVETYFAHQLAEDRGRESALIEALGNVAGDCYLTIDIDGLQCSFCPGTGTPCPGGLGWWQALRYLRRLLLENRGVRLIGCDIVETAPQPQSQVNEFTAVRILMKMLAYQFCERNSRKRFPRLNQVP